MDKQTKILAYQAIDKNIEHTTARQIVRYVMECELWNQDTVSPSNEYLAKKFGWSIETTKVAISKAKKSQFITTTGYGKNRCLELNIAFLKGKMAEQFQKTIRHKVDFSDVLPEKNDNSANGLANGLANGSANTLANSFYEKYRLTEPQNPKKGGDNNNNNNNNYSIAKKILENKEPMAGEEWSDNKKSETPTTGSQKSGRLYTENTFMAKNYLNFKIPMREDVYEDVVEVNGVLTPKLFWSETGKELSKGEINKLKPHSDFSIKAVKILQSKQGVFKLDGKDNQKYAEEFREMFIYHLINDKDYEPKGDLDLLNQFQMFLDLVIKHPFHGKNATNMAYLVRNFNKITREI